ncbi:MULTISPECIES: aromatic prenyltransferase [unclassified Streptomyces]|uniref:aromatic prenyltransferase n=1 Tax=unclassified Streptomyces TaxID=2593676 RepID=UPI00340952A3
MMSGTADPAGVYAAVEESAGLLGVACAREKVWPILTAFEEVLPDAVIAFRVATNARHEGEFDCRFTVPKGIDPYATALEKELTTPTGHPIESLVTEVQKHCAVDSYGVDFGVQGGFKKIWVYFPGGRHESISHLAQVPSMPAALARNEDFFARYGLADKVDLIGIDYAGRTMNVYFAASPEVVAPETVRAMHREMGLQEPSEQMLDFCGKAFGVYATVNWDSMKVERISYSVKTENPLELSARLGSKVEQFLKTNPYGAGTPKMVYAAVTSGGEEYYKLQSYYQWRTNSRLNLSYIGGRS